MHIGFWWVHHKEGNHSENLDVVGTIILKWVLKKQNGSVRTELILLTAWTTGMLLPTLNWTYGFHKMKPISSISGDILDSQGLPFMDLSLLVS